MPTVSHLAQTIGSYYEYVMIEMSQRQIGSCSAGSLGHVS